MHDPFGLERKAKYFEEHGNADAARAVRELLRIADHYGNARIDEHTATLAQMLIDGIPTPTKRQAETTDGYVCTVCHRNPVDALGGFDTCEACLRTRV